MSDKKEVSKEVRSLIDAIKASMTHAGDGKIDVAEDVYEKSLADTGLDLKVVKKVQKHNTQFAEAFVGATGETGIEIMKETPAIESVSAKTKAGNDRIEVLFDGKRELPDGKDGVRTEYGHSTLKYVTRAEGRSASLAAVQASLAEKAAKALG